MSFSAHPFTIPPYPDWPLLKSFGTNADWFKNPRGPVLRHSSVRVNVWCKWTVYAVHKGRSTVWFLLFQMLGGSTVRRAFKHAYMPKFVGLKFDHFKCIWSFECRQIHLILNKRLKCYFQSSALLFVFVLLSCPVVTCSWASLHLVPALSPCRY